MPRILVADDNSNIQKMVALALHDQGVEVVGVGNGEAAVRKVPEINPDVILADVFMPVRSGYEVCEFVKNDSRYMHTPVVLLVGAFDPLDEREAQRVRADGVLKKPFVPPEPLVNLVKALLVKAAGERLVAVAVPVASSSAAAEAERGTRSGEIHKPDFGDSSEDDVAIAPPKLKIGEYNKPLAFESLLDTVAETLPPLDETDPIVTASRDPNLGEPVFWTRPPQEETTATEEEDDEPTEHTWGLAESLPGLDETATLDPIGTTAFELSTAGTSAFDVLGTEVESAAVEPATVESPIEPVEIDSKTGEGTAVVFDTEAVEPPSSRLAEETSAPEVIEWPRPEDSVQVPAQSSPVMTAEPSSAAAGPDPDIEAPIGSEPPSIAASIEPSLETIAEQVADLQARSRIAPEPTEEPEDLSEGSGTETEDSETETTSSWPPPFQPVTTPAELSSSRPLSSLSRSLGQLPVDGQQELAGPTAADLRGIPEAADAMAEAATRLTSSSLKEVSPADTLSPEMIEAVVTRIVDRMQPKVIEVVTREILRPVVEALVRREIAKK